MNHKFFFFLLLFFAEFASAQVVNRYPYVQRPSQTSATIAWRRANPGIGTLYLGHAPGQWFDSLSTGTAEQKPYFDLVGLQPNTRYFYQCRTSAPNDIFTSQIDSFFTAPVDTTDRISFLAYGDCGYNNSTQHAVKNLMQMEKVDFAIVTGDIDQNIGDNYDNIFFGVYKDMLKRNCHFTCIGNHDTYADNAATYIDAFYLPHNNPANSERYYSFEWGDSKIICLDANINYAPGSPQFVWMVNELRCNDKKWTVVFFHQPPWTNAWSADYYIPLTPYFLYQGNTDMRTTLVPEFERYGVDFVVNGHSHCYQRGELNGVQYLITGGAGASTLDANTNSNAPNISREIYQNHYVRFDISGDTAKYVMISSMSQRMDSVIVVKPYTHYRRTLLNTDAGCFGYNDAQISLNVSGPANRSPYSFQWNNGATTANLSGLGAGTYTVTISDALGCQRFDSVLIEQPAQLITSISSSSGNFVICDGNPITLQAGGNHDYYIWSNGATTETIQINNGGSYSVTAYDVLGCSSPAAVQNVITANFPDSTNIQFQPNGLQLTVINNGSGFHFWNFGDGNSSNVNAPVHNYAGPGIYNVQVIVLNACGVDTFNYLIGVYPVALDLVENGFEVRIQPNPLKDKAYLYFNNSENSDFSLILTDVQGRVLRNYTKIKSNALLIEKKDLPSGTYFYMLSDGKSTNSGKIVIE
jgi:predicted phosphodiesterase